MQSINLVGRDKEINELNRFIEDAAKGNGKLVFISGEAGIGKTTLAEKCLILNSTKYYPGRPAHDITPPYGIFSSLIRTILRENEHNLEITEYTKSLSVILPESGNIEKEFNKEIIIEAIYKILITISNEKPASILLDDIQWADNASIELLLTLSDLLNNLKIILICTYRNDEIPRGHQLRWVRNELRRRKKLNEICLTTFDRASTEELIGSLLNGLPSAQLLNTIYQKTQGIPFFIEEFCETLLEKKILKKENGVLSLNDSAELPLPESIRDTILLKVSSLSEKANEMIELAAITGYEFDILIFEKILGSDANFDELIDSNLIYETNTDKAAFKHALIRDAVKSTIPWGKKRQLNKKIAEFLSEFNYTPDVIAEYWLEAKEFNRAKDLLVESAKRSCDIQAYRDAVKAGLKALEIWQEGTEENKRIETLFRLAHCTRLSGQLNEAVKALKEIVDIETVNKNFRNIGEANRALAIVYGLQGKWDLNLRSRINAAEAFEQAGYLYDSANEYLAAAARLMASIRLTEVIMFSDRVVQLSEKVNKLDLKSRALGIKGNALSMLGRTEEGRNLVQEGLELALNNNFNEAASEIYRRLASTMEYSSDYNSAKDAYYNAYNFCVTTGAEVSAQVCLGCMSYILFQTGEWKKSLELCTDVVRNVKSPDGSKLTAYTMSGIINAFRGEIKQANRNLDKALSLIKKYDSSLILYFIQWGKALTAELTNEENRTLEIYDEVLLKWKESQDRHDSILVLIWAAYYFGKHKKEKQLFSTAEAFSVIAGENSNPESLSGLAFTFGELEVINGNLAEAENQFRQAIDHQLKINVPLERIFMEIRLSEILIETGNKNEALERLNSAFNISRNLGTRPLSSRILALLEKFDSEVKEKRKPSVIYTSSNIHLTKRQNEILQLLVTGLTNKEIAGQLFVSTRTVDMHVGHIFERLNCRTRTEAVSRAGEIGII